MRSAKSMEWMANDLVRCMCETLFLSLSRASSPTHALVRSFKCRRRRRRLWLLLKKLFRIQDTRFFSIAKYVFPPYSCHALTTHTHTVTHAHYLRVVSDRTFELSTVSICHFDNNNNQSEKVKHTNDNETASGNEKWMSQIVSLKSWTTRKKERNIPNIIILEQASEPSPSMDYKCWACVMIGFKIGLVLHPSIHFVSHFVCFDFDVTVDFVIFSNGWQRVLIFKFCKRSPSNHKFVWVCVLNHEWRRRRRRCKPP